MNKNLSVVVSVLVVSLLFVATPGRAQVNKSDEDILVKFDNGSVITRGEFEYVYGKNNGGEKEAKKHTQEQYNEYLDLYIKFRQKVMDAEKAGLDTTRGFEAELSTYVKQLAQPYLIEKEVLDALIKTAWERSKQAVSASHILVRVARNASPADTIEAYGKILAYRDSVVKGGRDFGYMARRYSDDPSAKQHKGYLSYFTAFDFVVDFENGAFNTDVNKVSQPIRSDFGYHLIYVHNKVTFQKKRDISFILIRQGPAYEAKDSASAYARAMEAYQHARKETFSEVAKLYSDDPGTKKKGGKLGSRYIAIPEMQDKRFELDYGEVSQPFLTPHGWVIMKVEEGDKIKSFEESKAGIKSMVMRDGRAKIAESSLTERLKKQYNYTINQGNYNLFKEAAGKDYDMIGYNGEGMSEDMKESELFGFANNKYTINDLLKHIQRKRTRNPDRVSIDELLEFELDEVAKAKLMEYEESRLPEKYPEFKRLTQEYRDGILLFTLTEEKVWRKAVNDSAGLRNFYDNNMSKFMGEERVSVREYRSRSQKDLEKVAALYKEHNDKSIVDSLLVDRDSKVRISANIYNRTSKEGALLYGMREGALTEIKKEGTVYLLQYISQFREKGIKPFEECRSDAITLYQDSLEKNWLEKLAQTYPYRINEKNLKKLYN